MGWCDWCEWCGNLLCCTKKDVKEPTAEELMAADVKRRQDILAWMNFFLGEIRDGLPMLNLQCVYLIITKHYSEKQSGFLFFTFGISQFMFQTTMGYYLDGTNKKTLALSAACAVSCACTIITWLTATDYGANYNMMVLNKFIQGIATAVVTPGLNSITQGMVGSIGMTNQVSRSDMMSHAGTTLLCLFGATLAYFLYPNIGLVFVACPVSAGGVIFNLWRIRPGDIDHDAARGLTTEAANKDTSAVADYGSVEAMADSDAKAETPMQVLRDPVLFLFCVITFIYDVGNATVLPLCMQTLALGNGAAGSFMSSSCIMVAQFSMIFASKLVGDYSGTYGRKTLFSIGFYSVPIRCFILVFLVLKREVIGQGILINLAILSTQILDGIGSGTFGTMYVLVSSDLAGGTGRFSLILGLTTSAMSIGGTFSGYLGQALAEDYGYPVAFGSLGLIAAIPATLYLFVMPETLPSIVEERKKKEEDKVSLIT